MSMEGFASLSFLWMEFMNAVSGFIIIKNPVITNRVPFSDSYSAVGSTKISCAARRCSASTISGFLTGSTVWKSSDG